MAIMAIEAVDLLHVVHNTIRRAGREEIGTVEADVGVGHGHAHEVTHSGREIADVWHVLGVNGSDGSHSEGTKRVGGGDGAQPRGDFVVRRSPVIAPLAQSVVAKHEEKRVGRKVVKKILDVTVELPQRVADVRVGGGRRPRLVSVVVDEQRMND